MKLQSFRAHELTNPGKAEVRHLKKDNTSISLAPTSLIERIIQQKKQKLESEYRSTV